MKGILLRDLEALSLEELGISEYIQVYLEGKLSRSTMMQAEYILGLALRGKKLEECCLVDYGGGVGTLSLLAKKLGVGTVIYNDIYNVSCRDAQVIAKAVEAEADYYSVSVFTPYYGTQAYRELEEQGRLPHNRHWEYYFHQSEQMMINDGLSKRRVKELLALNDKGRSRL